MIAGIVRMIRRRQLRRVQAEIAYTRDCLSHGHRRLAKLTDLERELQRRLTADELMAARITP